MLLKDAQIATLLWLVLALHLAIAFVAFRRPQGVPLMVVANALIGLAVLAYWTTRWHGYVTRGIHWYWTDQLFPAYAIGLVVVCLLYYAGRVTTPAIHGTLFGLHAAGILAAASFFSFVRFDRLW